MRRAVLPKLCECRQIALNVVVVPAADNKCWNVDLVQMKACASHAPVAVVCGVIQRLLIKRDSLSGPYWSEVRRGRCNTSVSKGGRK